MNDGATQKGEQLGIGRFTDDPSRAWTLPSEWYTDPAVFDAERRRIFYRNWWFIGHVEDLGTSGSYVTARVLDQEVFVVHGKDGVLRGFFNVCSHRAHPLLRGKGHCGPIICPYHAWAYNTEGRFCGARGLNLVADFDRAEANLKPIKVEVFAGLVFANLDDAARPLAESAPEVLGHLLDACPRLPELTHAYSFSVDIAANWKAVVDNNEECYHCAGGHPSFMRLIDMTTYRAWEYESATCHTVAGKRGKSLPYEVAADDPVQQGFFSFLWPNTVLGVLPGRDNFFLFQMVPIAPDRTRVDWHFWFMQPEPTSAEAALIAYLRDELFPEDKAFCEGVQRGLQSLAYRQGRLIANTERPDLSEHQVLWFHQRVRDSLTARDRSSPAP